MTDAGDSRFVGQFPQEFRQASRERFLARGWTRCWRFVIDCGRRFRRADSFYLEFSETTACIRLDDRRLDRGTTTVNDQDWHRNTTR